METKAENSYERDYEKCLRQGILGDKENLEIEKIIYLLKNRMPLEKRHKDHALKGDYKGYRDCHINPDLVLVYKIQNDTLYLTRIGRHRDIFKGYS